MFPCLAKLQAINIFSQHVKHPSRYGSVYLRGNLPFKFLAYIDKYGYKKADDFLIITLIKTKKRAISFVFCCAVLFKQFKNISLMELIAAILSFQEIFSLKRAFTYFFYITFRYHRKSKPIVNSVLTVHFAERSNFYERYTIS